MRPLLFLLVSAACAFAEPLTVTTAGTFTTSTPASTLTEPGAAWSLSFNVDSSPGVANVSPGNGFDVQYSAFQYLVDGSRVTLPVADIRFFANGTPGGLFSVCFQTLCPGNAPPAAGLVFEGIQAYSGVESAPTIDPGVYTPTLEGVRDGSLRQVLPTSTVSIAAIATPEPASFFFVAVGLLSLGVALFSRRRRTSECRVR